MAVLAVRLYGDPVLRQKAAPVAAVTEEVLHLVDEMIETMHEEVGVGLAAVQVGVPLRILVLDEGKGLTRAYLNPTIVDQGGEEIGEEGCLSIPGIYADVVRAAWVVVVAGVLVGVVPRLSSAAGAASRSLSRAWSRGSG